MDATASNAQLKDIGKDCDESELKVDENKLSDKELTNINESEIDTMHGIKDNEVEKGDEGDIDNHGQINTDLNAEDGINDNVLINQGNETKSRKRKRGNKDEDHSENKRYKWSRK